MRKLTLIVLSALVLFIACKKTEIIIPEAPAFLEPKQEQWGLAINYTATWCGFCGSWGAPLIHDFDKMGKVVTVANHDSGDPMFNLALKTQMSVDRPVGSGIPSFWVGDEKTKETSKMTQLLAKIPTAGIDMKIRRIENSMKIAYMVKFFSAGVGDYYFSLWMLESGIDGSSSAGSFAQAGTSDPNFKHDFVFRKAYGNKVYGEKILTNPATGATHEGVVDMPIDAAWKKNVYIAACLWRYDTAGNPAANNPNYKFVNGFVVAP